MRYTACYLSAAHCSRGHRCRRRHSDANKQDLKRRGPWCPNGGGGVVVRRHSRAFNWMYVTWHEPWMDRHRMECRRRHINSGSVSDPPWHRSIVAAVQVARCRLLVGNQLCMLHVAAVPAPSAGHKSMQITLANAQDAFAFSPYQLCVVPRCLTHASTGSWRFNEMILGCNYVVSQGAHNKSTIQSVEHVKTFKIS